MCGYRSCHWHGCCCGCRPCCCDVDPALRALGDVIVAPLIVLAAVARWAVRSPGLVLGILGALLAAVAVAAAVTT